MEQSIGCCRSVSHALSHAACLYTNSADTTVSHMFYTMQDPFKRAEIWLRHRKEAKLQESSIWKSLLVTCRLLCPARRIDCSPSYAC